MKSNNILKIVIVALVVLFAGYLVYASLSNPDRPADNSPTSTEPVVCTMEAKLCSDGSYVGRTGPNCEFSPCPASSTIQGWKTATGTPGITFQYPENLGTKYINTVDWPPKIQVLNQPFTCTEGGTATGRAGETVKKTFAGKEYCVTTETEGAAGSTYLQYAYGFGFNGKTVMATFTLQEPQCGNYNDPEKTECQNERNSFNIDTILAQMVKTVRLK
jgi:hypothetical protein